MRIGYFLFLLMFLTSLVGCGQEHSSTNSDSSENVQFSYVELPETVAEVEALEAEAIDRLNAAIEEILGQQEHDFANTIHALNDAVFHEFKNLTTLCSITADLSIHDDVRAAASRCQNELSYFNSQIFQDQLLYAAFTDTIDNTESLNDEQDVLLSRIASAFKSNDLDMDAAERLALISLKEQINDRVARFNNNIYATDLTINLTPEDLSGLSESELSLFKRDGNGNYIYQAISTAQTLAVWTYAVSEETRELVYKLNYSIAAAENPALFAEIVELRARMAELYGYESFADYRLASLMAGTPRGAEEFLQYLYDEIADKQDMEKQLLLELKRQDTGDAQATLERWDIPFYENLYAEVNFQLDLSSMKKYFEMERVLQGMFDLFEDVLDIQIFELDSSETRLWSDSVRLYEVYDGSTDEPLGLFYFDPYPRAGKANYYGMWPVALRNRSANGELHLPSVLLVGNWAEPDSENNIPSLLTFDDLVNLFHEFGHVLHGLLMDVDYANLADSRRDFIEVPSQVFERWCYDQEVLETFAVSYLDETDVLPADFAEKVTMKEKMFSGIELGSQIAYGMADLSIYSLSSVEAQSLDVDAVYNDMAQRYYMPFPADASRMAQLSHIVSGYSSSYYVYQWSNAMAADIKTVFEESYGGLFDSEIGQLYRTEILAPGLSRYEYESLHRFLGRDWAIDAYVDELTIDQ